MSDDLQSYLPSLRRFAMSLTNCRDLAEEVAQESLLRAMQRNSDLPPISQPKNWLFQIAVNICKERWRREARRLEVELQACQRDSARPTSNPVDIASQHEHLQRVWAFVETLPKTQRDVLLLNVWERLKHRQIADRLGISEASVKSSLSIARSKLRNHFFPENERE